jgi:hypothetical protein
MQTNTSTATLSRSLSLSLSSPCRYFNVTVAAKYLLCRYVTPDARQKGRKKDRNVQRNMKEGGTKKGGQKVDLCFASRLIQMTTHDTHSKMILKDMGQKGLKIQHRRVYTKVTGMAAWSENCKWYSSLPLGAVVSLFCESVK